MKSEMRLLLAVALCIALGLALSLAACSGGGGGNDNGTNNSAPVANAGSDQNITAGKEVILDGSGSSDADLDTLTYNWSIANVPAGSSVTDADLSDATAVSPAFLTDLRGQYVVQLIVNDGTMDSAADKVTITARSWGTAELIETNNYNADAPQVALGANGDAMAIWVQDDSTFNSIYANRYAAGTGWGTAELVETEAFNAEAPQVALDASGNAFTVWAHSYGEFFAAYTRRYVAGTGWDSLWSLDEDFFDSNSVHVALDDNGNAIVVWVQNSNICAKRYEAGTGWLPSEIIDDGFNNADSPQVAFDSSGNAVAVWRENGSIYSNRYVAGTGWGAAESIEGGSGSTFSPQVAVDASGNAVAVWQQWDSTFVWRSIYANRYDAGTGWGTEEVIDVGANHASSPQVAVDAGGNAIAVWEQSDGTYLNIYAKRYDAGTASWGTAEIIDAGDNHAIFPQVAFDASGSAIAVWEQNGSIYANHYNSGTGWGVAEVIETDSGDAGLPQVAVDADGNAFAVWRQLDGTYVSIYANRYE